MDATQKQKDISEENLQKIHRKAFHDCQKAVEQGYHAAVNLLIQLAYAINIQNEGDNCYQNIANKWKNRLGIEVVFENDLNTNIEEKNNEETDIITSTSTSISVFPISNSDKENLKEITIRLASIQESGYSTPTSKSNKSKINNKSSDQLSSQNKEIINDIFQKNQKLTLNNIFNLFEGSYVKDKISMIPSNVFEKE